MVITAHFANSLSATFSRASPAQEVWRADLAEVYPTTARNGTRPYQSGGNLSLIIFATFVERECAHCKTCSISRSV